MSELLDNPPSPIQEMDDEQPVQPFCKFTFAQFFTIMILAVFTMGFMFYLGARYGNDYLRLGQVHSSPISTASISTVSGVAEGPQTEKTEEMLKSAREVLQQQQSEKLQEQVSNVLQNPAAYQQQLAQQGQAPLQLIYPPKQQVVTPQDQAIAAIQQAQMAQQQPTMPTTVAQTANTRINEYEPPVAASAQLQLSSPQAIPRQPTADDLPAEPVQSKGSLNSSFSVQVAASQNMAEANQWVQNWRDRGYSAFLMVADLPEKGRWYRVRLGTFPSRDTAETFASQLKTKEQVDAIAVQNE